MKIKLKQNIDGLFALQKLCNVVLEMQESTTNAKMIKSIIEDVLKLVNRPLQTAIENNNLFDCKKKHTITLKFHEAYTLHEGILGLINTIDNPLAKTKLNQIKDFLNRQIT